MFRVGNQLDPYSAQWTDLVTGVLQFNAKYQNDKIHQLSLFITINHFSVTRAQFLVFLQHIVTICFKFTSQNFLTYLFTQRTNDITRTWWASSHLADAAAYAADVMAAILKVWPHISNPTPSVNAYLLEKLSCPISSRSDLKWRSNKKNNRMSSDMGSVSDHKNEHNLKLHVAH